MSQDYIATGHYVISQSMEKMEDTSLRAIDLSKDQGYVLYS